MHDWSHLDPLIKKRALESISSPNGEIKELDCVSSVINVHMTVVVHVSGPSEAGKVVTQGQIRQTMRSNVSGGWAHVAPECSLHWPQATAEQVGNRVCDDEGSCECVMMRADVQHGFSHG